MVGVLSFAVGCGGECVNCTEPDSAENGVGSGSDRPDPNPDPADPPHPEPDPGPGDPEPPPDDPGTVRDIAIFARDIPSLAGAVDPATLYLFVGTTSFACDEPFGPIDCGKWRVNIPVPPDRQLPGTFALEEVLASMSFGGAAESNTPTECGFGGGSFYDGFITIDAIDAENVSFTLQETSTFDVAANGSYTTPVCGAGEP